MAVQPNLFDIQLHFLCILFFFRYFCLRCAYSLRLNIKYFGRSWTFWVNYLPIFLPDKIVFNWILAHWTSETGWMVVVSSLIFWNRNFSCQNFLTNLTSLVFNFSLQWTAGWMELTLCIFNKLCKQWLKTECALLPSFLKQ